jgi:hypothetical protein
VKQASERARAFGPASRCPQRWRPRLPLPARVRRPRSTTAARARPRAARARGRRKPAAMNLNRARTQVRGGFSPVARMAPRPSQPAERVWVTPRPIRMF